MTTPTPALRLSGTDHDDRRRHKRFDVARHGKLFRRLTQQYASITTRNLSYSGALIEVAADRPFNVGELIDLGICFNRSAAVVVNSQALLRGIVTRVEPSPAPDNTRQTIAVRYIQPSELVSAA